MIDKAVAYLKKNTDQYEIYEEDTILETTDANKDKIQFSTSNETNGIAFRVAIGKKKGFAYTNNAKDYKKTIGLAIKTAKLAPEDKNFESFAKDKKIKLFNQVDKSIAALQTKEIKNMFQDFISDIKSVNKKIILSEANYNKSYCRCRIINSEGIDVETRAMDNSLDASITIKKDGRIECIDDGWAGWKPLKNLPAKEYARRLILQLDKKPLKTGKMQLILHPQALAWLLNVSMQFNCNAENVMHKKSIWHNMLDKQVFDKKITIHDDGITKKYLTGRPFDDEGSPTQITQIVKNGILQSFLHNTYTANYFKTKNTSNAYRLLPVLPAVNFNSIIIDTGDKNCVKEADKAIYVRSLLGVHTMNASTGNFSLGVLEGYQAKNSSLGNAVSGTMIAGNILELMKNVVVVGKKQETCFVGNGYYAPEMLFKEIKVIS